MIAINDIMKYFFVLILLFPTASCHDKGNSSYGEKIGLRHLKKGKKKDKTRAPTSLPTASSPAPSVHVSSEPSMLPSALPNVMPSTVPSTVPSYSPTTFSSVLPSGVPSLLPTILPSVAPTKFRSSTPSSTPTISPFCKYINPDITLSAKMGKTNYCYRIQTRPGGNLWVDTKDEGCKTANSGGVYSGKVYSAYQRTSPGGIAIYEGNFDGTIRLLRDPSLTEPRLEVVASVKRKKFSMTLTVPDCGPPPFCDSISHNEFILPSAFTGTLAVPSCA